MANLLGGRNKRLVLDIGSSCIRLCELTQTKTGYQLSRYLQKEYNANPNLEEEERKTIRQKALQELLKEGKVKNRKTIFGVPGQSVFTRRRALPPVPENKVSQIVRYEIQQQIPFGLDQIAMDYQVLDRTAAGGYEVMMAAIKVDVVDKHVEILHNSKCGVEVVDVNSLAGYNWLKHAGEFGEGTECIALIDMGATTTDIVIEREGNFQFTRPLNIGGNDITLALSNATGLNFGDAERLKRERAFAPTGDPERDGKPGEVIGQVLQRLVTEIMRSFAYFRSLPGGGQVHRVILSGGGACLRNIVPYLQSQLGLEVRLAQPLAGLAVGPDAQQVNEHPEQACVALGMALRDCEDVAIQINLVPPLVLEMAHRKKKTIFMGLCILMMMLIMFSVVPSTQKKIDVVREQKEKMLRAIQQYDPKLAQLLRAGQVNAKSSFNSQMQAAKKELLSVAQQVEFLDSYRNDRKFWLDELKMINEARPPRKGIWFSAVKTVRIAKKEKKAGRVGGLLANLPVAAQNQQDPDKQEKEVPVEVTEFPGVDAPAQKKQNQRTGGTRLRRGAQKNNSKFEPNGFIVHGFAETYDVITEYITALKEAEGKNTEGEVIKIREVHFSESSIHRLPFETLYNAPITEVEGSKKDDKREGYGTFQTSSIYSFTLKIVFQYGESAAGTPSAGAANPAGNGQAGT